MLRQIKIVFTMLIVMIIIGFSFVPLISYAIDEESTYLALGDSIAYGYGLENRDTQSYAARVKGKYNIGDAGFKNLAVSGMTCKEFYEKIQEASYTDAIEEADLITISIGSNELLHIAVEAVSEVTGVSTGESDFESKAKQAFFDANALQKATMLKGIYDYFTSEGTKGKIQTAIQQYEEYWGKSVEYITGKNPDVTIVATQFYNPYYGLDLLGYGLGTFVDQYIQQMNQILENKSNSEDNYKIAKIYSSFNTKNPRVTNVNISLTNFDIDPHPNKTGHEIIYTKIIDALSETVSNKKDITGLTINNIPDQVYTGEELEPEITIMDGETKLVKNEDYTVSYSNNKNIGEATVTIIGIGKYEGTIQKTFNIAGEGERKDISNVTIQEVEEQTYVGYGILPEVEITDGETKLEKNRDYKLNYTENVNVGTATITITGIGNYTGTKEITFRIIEKDIGELTIQDIPNQTYTGKELEPELTITYGSIGLVKDTDYIVTYSDNTNIGEATVTIKGKGNYKGEITKKFNIVEQSIEESKDIAKLEISDIEDKTYTGELITPEITIKDGENTLKKDEDYIISFKNNTNVGKATVIITGKGKYTGKVEKTFNILSKSIKNVKIQDIEDQIYTGENIEPEVTIYDGENILEEGTDYVLEYTNNVSKGTATIKITGKGNYSGTVTKTFSILETEGRNNNSEAGIKEDAMAANKVIPYAGTKIIVYCLILVGVMAAIIFYKKMREYKNI